jgi:hypothetical protein
MADASSAPNPFRNQEPSAPQPDDAALRPFTVGRIEPGNDLRRHLGRRLRDMSLGGVGAAQATPRAQELTVKDLNDLAAEFSGIRTGNQGISQLSIEDLNSIEAVFFDVKMNAARTAREAAAAPAGEAAPIFDDWSCCCCTPCCCCAAADIDPLSA